MKNIKKFDDFNKINEEVGVISNRGLKNNKEKDNLKINDIFSVIKDTFDETKLKKYKYSDDNSIKFLYIDKKNDIHFSIEGPILGVGRFNQIWIDDNPVQYTYKTFVKIFTFFRLKNN